MTTAAMLTLIQDARAAARADLLSDLAALEADQGTAATGLVVEGYLDGVADWLVENVGPIAAYEMLQRAADQSALRLPALREYGIE